MLVSDEIFAIPAEELAARCHRRAMKYWDRLPTHADPEDVAQEAILYIIRQGLCRPGTDIPFITHIIKAKVATAVHATWKRKINELMSPGLFEEDTRGIADKGKSPEAIVEDRDLIEFASNGLCASQQDRLNRYIDSGGSYDVPNPNKEMAAMYVIRKNMSQKLRLIG